MKIQYQAYGQEKTRTGVVVSQELKKNSLFFRMCLTDGSDVAFGVSQDNKPIVTSVRMDPNLRSALMALYKAKTASNAFMVKMNAEKARLDALVETARGEVRANSEDMSFRDFADAALALFNKRFPSSGRHNANLYFTSGGVGENEISMVHVQEIEKYASPDTYPFIGRHYDDTPYICTEHPSYKQFCERHAPKVLSILAAYSTTEVDAQIGDKNFLTAERSYLFQLPDGLTKKSLRYLEDILYGRALPAPRLIKKKAPLDKQIQSADAKPKASAGPSQKNQTPRR